MAIQIQVRRDSAADWTSNDPTLAAGEHGFETDTGLFKIGDGATAWTALAYAGGGGGTAQGTDGTYDIEAADEGATAGNARGENSVDLCTKRSNAAYVPSGICSANIAGENIGGSGTHSLISGKNNHTNTGKHCIISGSYNYTNSGDSCIISGSYNYSNSGDYCNISGLGNSGNSGSRCLIAGYYLRTNSGKHCIISGSYNYSNSGDYCSISGYFNNTNTGDYCSISGSSNSSNIGTYCSISGLSNYSNSGTHCSIDGYNNNSNTGDYCSISGVANNTNSGNYCLITGSFAASNALDYARVHGGNNNARIIDLVAQRNSSGTGATELLLGGALGTRIIIPDQSAWNVDVRFVAKTATGANAAIQNFTGVIVRDGTSTTYAAGTSDAAITEIGTTNAAFTVSADDTNEALKLTVAASSGTLRASARIQLTQVDY